MESAGEDLDNIFEDHETRENDGEPDRTENNAESNGVRVQPPKRIVKNPRLKFNPERLCGERGIPVLMEHFKNVKFKGKGHEKEDLDKLLSKLEHWTHRLFPSMKFEDCIHHIEKLGKKRPVQTCLRKIRLDMPILSSDFVKDDEEEDHVQRNEDSEPVEIDPFDRLIGESQNFNPITTTESMIDSNSLSMYSSPAQRDSATVSRGQVLGSAGSSLTEEQKERLERNRMLAIERRKARLTAVQQNAMESPLVSNDERSASQDLVAQSFDSLIGIKENKSDDLLMVTSNNKDYEKISDLKNPNSENLGLDDLIHLVEEEEPTSAKNSNSENLGLDDLIDLVEEGEPTSAKNVTISCSEESSMVCVNSGEKTINKNEFPEYRESHIKDSNLEDRMSCSILDDTVGMTVFDKTVQATEGESLELDSLMDLVNEDVDEGQIVQ